MDVDRITNPLRLARGSHQPGSGKGCAMNVISYINGDEQITDFPATSARPLASFVQLCNDLLAGPDGYLSPENSLLVLDLGWLTVGTADVANTVMHIWVTKLLISPPWGVVRYAADAAAEAITDIAELHRRLVPGDLPPIAEWDSCRPRCPLGQRDIGGRRTLRGPGSDAIDLTLGDRRLGHPGCGDGQRAARAPAGKRRSRSCPDLGGHSQRDPLVAAPRRIERGGQRSHTGCRRPAAQSRRGLNQFCRWLSRRSLSARVIAAVVASNAITARMSCEPPYPTEVNSSGRPKPMYVSA